MNGQPAAYAWKPAEAKTGLSRATLPESFLVSRYRALAPYRGCAHGCAYCDGRAEKYYVEGDFQRDILARTNLPDLVRRDVEAGVAAREYGAVCIGSGVTDVYQPLEAELLLTRRTLEALVPANLPVVILTKSSLVLRDFDILSQFPRALVICTLTTADPELAAILEPGASPPAERLEVVRRAREAGFLSGVMAMPLCPGLSDSDMSFASLVDAAAAAGAGFVYPGGLTLRPGRQKDLFMSVIDAQFPELRPLYDELYSENRQSGAPLPSWCRAGDRTFDAFLRARRMPQMIPHAFYRELLSPPDSLFVLFCHMERLYALRGVDTRALKTATGRYADWLKAERASLGRARLPVVPSDPFPVTRILSGRLAELCERDRAAGKGDPAAVGMGASGSIRAAGGLSAVLGNERLAALAGAVVLDGTAFDYSALRLA